MIDANFCKQNAVSAWPSIDSKWELKYFLLIYLNTDERKFPYQNTCWNNFSCRFIACFLIFILRRTFARSDFTNFSHDSNLYVLNSKITFQFTFSNYLVLVNDEKQSHIISTITFISLVLNNKWNKSNKSTIQRITFICT